MCPNHDFQRLYFSALFQKNRSCLVSVPSSSKYSLAREMDEVTLSPLVIFLSLTNVLYSFRRLLQARALYLKFPIPRNKWQIPNISLGTSRIVLLLDDASSSSSSSCSTAATSFCWCCESTRPIIVNEQATGWQLFVCFLLLTYSSRSFVVQNNLDSLFTLVS
jgi:hypothetical protein